MEFIVSSHGADAVSLASKLQSHVMFSCHKREMGQEKKLKKGLG